VFVQEPARLFVLITLGVSLLCMLALQRLRGLLARVLLAYGRTPLFTYVLHIYVVHGSWPCSIRQRAGSRT
jgi:uncharacterized membrane protein